mmetsp:Transcript_33711/g.76971  ORF Transcript_33711/g.76971 Transcript_33711/m.76971 type:complete len:246 (+) Transcript_33711:1114-1851(+)
MVWHRRRSSTGLSPCARRMLRILGSGSTKCRRGSTCSVSIRLFTICRIHHHGAVDGIFAFSQFVECGKGARLLLPWRAGIWLANFHQASLESPLLLRQQMVRGRYVIVFVHLQALDCILPQESKSLEVFNQVLLQLLAAMAELGCHRGFWDLCKPRVQSHLLCSYSVDWIRGQQPLDEVANCIADEVWGLVITSKDLLVKLRGILVLEGQVSTDQGKQYDPTAPEITASRHVPLPSYHLWRRVTW